MGLVCCTAASATKPLASITSGAGAANSATYLRALSFALYLSRLDAARLCQTRNKARGDWICDHYKYDRQSDGASLVR